jgi:hypothetical protein
MTLFIQSDAGGDGTGDTVHPLNAHGDLIQISNMDLGGNGHVGYGEVDGPVADLSQVTYDQSTSGPCPTRLSSLVNTNFGVNAQNIDIIVLAVGFNFTLTDGTLMAGNGTSRPPNVLIPDWTSGTAFQAGQFVRSNGNGYLALNSATSGSTPPSGTAAFTPVSDGAVNWEFLFSGANFGNPTQSVLTIYDMSDNNGNGVCEKGLASQQYDLSAPSPVTLYHELSHALRLATRTTLSLIPPDPSNFASASPEEHQAEVDENDMRTQLGQPLRDPNDHGGMLGMGGSCAAPSCCVVASVATGTPYSSEVNALRAVRDGVLRRSEIGFDFFAHLHADYYGFSPQVCRMMARSGDLLARIRSYFVEPLTLCLDLLRGHTLDRVEPHALGAQLDHWVRGASELAALTAADLDAARAILDHTAPGAVPPAPPYAELAALLDSRARSSPFVTWALFDPISIVIDALAWRLEGVATADIGHRLAAAFDAWAVRMPLTDVWRNLSRYALAEEIAFLGRALVRGADARAAFRDRVVQHLPERTDLTRLFDEAWSAAPARLEP